jgi:hypothetical protein
MGGHYIRAIEVIAKTHCMPTLYERLARTTPQPFAEVSAGRGRVLRFQPPAAGHCLPRAGRCDRPAHDLRMRAG